MTATDFLIPVTVMMPQTMLGRIQGVARRHEVDAKALIVELCRRALEAPQAAPSGHRGGVRGNRHVWTAEHDDALRRLHAEQKRDHEISAILGFSSKTVMVRRRELGLAAHTRHPWPPEVDERLKELHALGWSDNRIGKALGCNHATISAHRGRLGLPRLYVSLNPNNQRPDPVLALAEGVVADAT